MMWLACLKRLFALLYLSLLGSYQGCYLGSSVLAALVGFLVRCIAPGVLLSKGYRFMIFFNNMVN